MILTNALAHQLETPIITSGPIKLQVVLFSIFLDFLTGAVAHQETPIITSGPIKLQSSSTLNPFLFHAVISMRTLKNIKGSDLEFYVDDRM